MAKRLRYTVEQALSQDPNKLTEKELRAAVQALADASNKRIKRAVDKGAELPPALAQVISQGKITTKDKNLQQLRKEYARATRQFSAVSGGLQTFGSFKRQVRGTLRSQRGINITDAEWDRFWRAYEELKAKDDKFKKGAPKYALLENIAEISKNSIDVASIVSALENRLTEIYEEQKEAQQAMEEVEDEYGDLPF